MKIVIVILVIIAIPFVVALFTAKAYTVERDITINRPSQDVFNYIKLIRNQQYYSKWVMDDPNAKKEYVGVDGTPGFLMSWNSQVKSVGEGSQTITNIVDGRRIDLDLKFIRPMKGNSAAYMTTEAVGPAQTKVRWVFEGKMNYPMNFMLLVINMDKLLGKDLSTSLATLKGVLEK